MTVRATLAMTLLMFAAAETDRSASVKFHGVYFTMTCPLAGTVTWYQYGGVLKEDRATLTRRYRSDTKGLCHCTNGLATYYFYVKGRVCENCIEVDAVWFAVALFVDASATILLMVVIYKCTKKKHAAGPAGESRAPARTGGRAPPAQSPYESLNPHTRTQDPYSFVSRTG